MSTYDITTPSPPTTAAIAAQLSAILAAQSGVLTDFNEGSQIRALAEAIASIIDINQTENESSNFQAITNACYSAFGITPLGATYAEGTVLFSTAVPPNAPASPNTVPIPQGTVVQTSGGIQFETTSDVTLTSGSSGVYANIQAVQAGSAGNIPASGIVSIASGLSSSLYVSNPLPTAGGANAETAQQTASRFANTITALHLSSPAAVASACVGVTSGAEIVKYATCYEPWIDQAVGSQTPGFSAIIDNGTGTATSGLISAVKTKLDGDVSNFTESGYRPVGVPYYVVAVTPTVANVTVTATVAPESTKQQVDAQISSAVQYYFSLLNFGDTAENSKLNTQVANALSTQVTSLSVQLEDSGNATQSSITPATSSRIVLNTLTLNT